MSPALVRPNRPPVLQDAESRSKVLRGIAERRGIPNIIQVGYISWSFPSEVEDERKGKAEFININLLGLCSPGASIFKQIDSPDGILVLNPHLQRFHSTPETRCVRDIKRLFSWKIYGISYTSPFLPDSINAHYIRVSFSSACASDTFSTLSNLLDSISATRYLLLPSLYPFGIGLDTGVPPTHEHLYLINSCAKITPSSRKVLVDFELNVSGNWIRFDGNVDRIGFATYRSSPKRRIVSASGPEDVHFIDDPYVRFGRMTLRFAGRKERIYIDLEGDEASMPHISKTRKGSVVYLQKVRVRASEPTTPSNLLTCSSGNLPYRTMARLVFREKTTAGGFLWTPYAKTAVSEAEKLAGLIQKTTRIAAAANCIGIRHSVNGTDIVELPITSIQNCRNFGIKLPGRVNRQYADITEKFRENINVYAVPTHRTNSNGGIAIIAQSADGELIIRQHIDDPVELIASISQRGFRSSLPSSITTTKARTRVAGSGTLKYNFASGEMDAVVVIDKLTRLIASIDTQCNLPSRLPVLKSLAGQKRRLSAGGLHSRSNSDGSDVSDVSDASNMSDQSMAESVNSWTYTIKSSTSSGSERIFKRVHRREPSDWDILESLTADDVFGEELVKVKEEGEIKIGMYFGVLSGAREGGKGGYRTES